MNLRGILIEYFITGGFALIWFFLIIEHTGIYSEIKEIDNKVLIGIIAIPTVYMIGIIVDHIGRVFTEKIKFLLVKGLKNKKFEEVKNFTVAEIYFKSPELGKQYEMRSSRDRIARGSIINTLILTTVFLVILPQESTYFLYTLYLGLLILSLFVFIWIRFQKLSIQFIEQCKQLIRHSENR